MPSISGFDRVKAHASLLHQSRFEPHSDKAPAWARLELLQLEDRALLSGTLAFGATHGPAIAATARVIESRSAILHALRRSNQNPCMSSLIASPSQLVDTRRRRARQRV